MRYVFHRLMVLVAALFVAGTIVFFLLRILPGNAAAGMAGIGGTQQQLEAAKRMLGLDRPVIVQFFSWFGGVFTGDFGESFISRVPVAGQIGTRLAVTAPLTIMGFLLGVVFALPLGAWSAIRRNTRTDVTISGLSMLGVATPVFWIGILLIEIVAMGFGILPSGGFPRDGWGDPGRALASLILPATTIGIAIGSIVIRYVRAAVIDVIDQDYVRTAQALGASRRTAYLRHVARNAATPVVVILFIQLSTAVLGAVVIENVFALPGLGTLLLDAVRQRDLPTVQGIIFVITAFVLVAGLISDLCQRAIDPRLRAVRTTRQAADAAGAAGAAATPDSTAG